MHIGIYGRSLTPELPVHVVLVPPLLRFQAPVPGLPSEVSYSLAVVVTKKLWICAGHRIVQSTLLLSFCCSAGGERTGDRRGRSSDGHIAMKLNKTYFISSRHN